MKNLTTFIAVTAFMFALSFPAIAVENIEGTKPAAPEKVAGEAKAIPMYTRVDSIDTAGKSFTMKRKDGVEVKHVVPVGTDIKQKQVAAKFEDIKVGDYVSGLRRKVSVTEYTVVKITKFGVPEKKP